MIKSEVRINRTLPTELIKLMNRCGARKRNPKTIIKALRDGLFMVGLYIDGELTAFGRVSGDGAMYFLITDVMIAPEFEDSGIDMQLYKEIDDYLLTVAPNDSRVLAMTHKKYEHIFRTFGYEYMDPDYRTVMIRE
ncbi:MULTISPECIES: hypothetical protein [Mogibacterium]|jgi:acetyltransferase, GNAT family|uniref:Acetyltransferase (GNAT) domain protein n=2 Tax=Mogibacterium timidum TaxID=35519 RepID=X8ITS3_9FIRM|nr:MULTISPECIES: hypothetical protein [Mogibacterium]EJU21027.1 hypothetical protein HMPREF1152_1542 [Mogibacterium sp. CM50]EUC53032.1 hypothetical protein HMPREF0581_0974 [Mogibacterium timidum ATCC 33093]NWO22783.1 hypothetical protein [Mogibacterium timidum]